MLFISIPFFQVFQGAGDMNRTEQSPAKAKRFSYSFRLVRRQRFGEYKHKNIAKFSITFS
jgi:hypothetical protein